MSVENNRISPDTIADLFESIASPNNGLIELRVAAQAQVAMGYRVECRIADAIRKNPRLMKIGMSIEFKVGLVDLELGCPAEFRGTEFCGIPSEFFPGIPFPRNFIPSEKFRGIFPTEFFPEFRVRNSTEI